MYFFPSQIVLSISTVTFFLPSQILIIFEIHIETLGTLVLLSYGAPRWLSPLLFCFPPEIFYIIERVKSNNMEFYVLLKSILFPLSHWKWVQLVLMVEGSSKQYDFFHQSPMASDPCQY